MLLVPPSIESHDVATPWAHALSWSSAPSQQHDHVRSVVTGTSKAPGASAGASILNETAMAHRNNRFRDLHTPPNDWGFADGPP